jgi:hypothetical protein
MPLRIIRVHMASFISSAYLHSFHTLAHTELSSASLGANVRLCARRTVSASHIIKGRARRRSFPVLCAGKQCARPSVKEFFIAHCKR